MASIERNNLDIYDAVAAKWWSNDIRWVRDVEQPRAGDAWGGLSDISTGPTSMFLTLAVPAGSWQRPWLTRGACVTGIDPAVQAIDAARTHADASGKAIKYDVGVGEDLPYKDDCFDAVVCVDVLEHVARFDQSAGRSCPRPETGWHVPV